MSVIIKLVRHGQSAANIGAVKGWEVGDQTIPLTELGRGQARAAGAEIGHDFLAASLVYTSPSRRARETLAGLLAGAGLSGGDVRMYEDPRLREVEHGYVDVAPQRPLQATHSPFFYRFHGGESPADCYDRTSGFLEGMMRQVERKQTRRVVIVTHGITIRCFVMRFLHLTVEQFDTMRNPKNCGVITLAGLGEIDAPVFATSRWGVSGIELVSA